MTLADERARLAEVLDALIPPTAPFPGAGTAALDHVLAAAAGAPDLDALLGRALRAVAEAAGPRELGAMGEDEREGALRRAEQVQPDAFAALVQQAYMGYYGHPAVIAALGLDPAPVHPRGHRPEPVDPPDLARVAARGSIYRVT